MGGNSRPADQPSMAPEGCRLVTHEKPIPVGKGKESGVRLDLLKQQCPIGEHFLSDPDFTMIAVRGAH